MQPHELRTLVQQVAAGIAQSDACAGGPGHVSANDVRASLQTRAVVDEELRRALGAAGGARQAVSDMFVRGGWEEVEAGVWAPVEVGT